MISREIKIKNKKFLCVFAFVISYNQKWISFKANTRTFVLRFIKKFLHLFENYKRGIYSLHSWFKSNLNSAEIFLHIFFDFVWMLGENNECCI